MNKKQIAVSFLHLAASGKVREAYEKYIHPDFRHHNPYFRGDRKALLTGMEENAVQFPNKELQIIHAIEEEDLVAVHASIRLRPDLPEIALIHIFRFENDLIIEEWEASQEKPEITPNENGMF